MKTALAAPTSLSGLTRTTASSEVARDCSKAVATGMMRRRSLQNCQTVDAMIEL